MMTGSFVDLNYACEESFVDYLIANVGTPTPYLTPVTYYTGTGNVDELAAPSVFVRAEIGTETHPFSNVYDMSVNFDSKEIASDTNSGSLGVLAANIYNALTTSSLKSLINQNNQRNFSSLFIERIDKRHSVNGDTLITSMTLRVIGCLSGSL